MRTYNCNFISIDSHGSAVDLDSPFWENAEILEIDEYPWKNEQRPYTPKVQVRLLHSAEALLVRFDVWEEHIRATYTQPNDPVCRDSCVEFFFHPDANDDRYLSFEINPLGTLLIGLGASGSDISYLPDGRERFCIQTARRESFWQVTYTIPFVFVKTYFSNISCVMRGNFMKCADRSATPHHGCWSLIGTDIPMFHVPQFFGEIRLIGPETVTNGGTPWQSI